jgi:hypothetical protein
MFQPGELVACIRRLVQVKPASKVTMEAAS